MTIIDMLDALEAGIFRLHATNGSCPSAALASKADPVHAGALRAQLEKTGLSPGEFTTIFGVQPSVFEDWLGGGDVIPSWVPASIQVLALIPPSARRRLRRNCPMRYETNPARSHPFSRIEEL